MPGSRPREVASSISAPIHVVGIPCRLRVLRSTTRSSSRRVTESEAAVLDGGEVAGESIECVLDAVLGPFEPDMPNICLKKLIDVPGFPRPSGLDASVLWLCIVTKCDFSCSGMMLLVRSVIAASQQFRTSQSSLQTK